MDRDEDIQGTFGTPQSEILSAFKGVLDGTFHQWRRAQAT